MRTWLTIAACSLLLACSAPEDSNPAVRCGADDSCEDGLSCYRGFCVEDGDEPELPISIADASAVGDASVAAPRDAALVSTTGGDAAEVFIQDVPGTLTPAVTTTETTPVVTTPVVTTPVVTTPVVTTPVVTTPPPVSTPAPVAPTAIPCQAQCTNVLANDKPCKDCFKSSFGDDPEKLCGTNVAALNPLLQTVCASICATGKAKGPSGCRGN